MPRTTYVTSFFDIGRKRHGASEYKSFGEYWLHIETLLRLDIDLVVYTTKPLMHMMKYMRPAGSNTKWVPMLLEDLKFDLDAIQRGREKTPVDNANKAKDTAAFTALTVAKFEFMQRAIQSNDFKASGFAWIDIGLARVVGDVASLVAFDASAYEKVSLGQMNYLDPKDLKDRRTLYSRFRYHFCGGFFFGRAKPLSSFCGQVLDEFQLCLKENMAPSDEQLLGWWAGTHPTELRFYMADYYDLLSNVDETRGNGYLALRAIYEARRLGDKAFYERAASSVLDAARNNTKNNKWLAGMRVSATEWDVTVQPTLWSCVQFASTTAAAATATAAATAAAAAIVPAQVERKQEEKSAEKEDDDGADDDGAVEDDDPIEPPRYAIPHTHKPAQPATTSASASASASASSTTIGKEAPVAAAAAAMAVAKEIEAVDTRIGPSATGSVGKYVVAIVASAAYTDKAESTISQLRDTKKWDGDIVLVYGNDSEPDRLSKLAKKYNVVCRYFPDVDSTTRIAKITRRPFYDATDNGRETKLPFQYHKLHMFHTYWRRWSRVLYLDAGTSVYFPIAPVFDQVDCEGRIAAPCERNHGAFSRQWESRAFPELVSELAARFDMSTDKFFINAMFLFDTTIIEDDTWAELWQRANHFVHSRTNEMAIMNLYFAFEKKQWTPTPASVRYADKDVPLWIHGSNSKSLVFVKYPIS